MKKYSFSKNMRLVKNEQFKAVLSRKMCAGDKLLILYMAENEIQSPRLGISIGKSIGNAVFRNRIKRLLRESFRQNQDKIPTGFDYVVMKAANKNGIKKNEISFEQINRSFISLVEQIKRRNQLTGND